MNIHSKLAMGILTSSQRILYALCFTLLVISSCKKESSKEDDESAPKARKVSSISVLFKGKTIIIPYVNKPGQSSSVPWGWESIEPYTFTRSEELGFTKHLISTAGFSGYSNELEIDIGGTRRGEPSGVYKFEKYVVGSEQFYFGVYLWSRSSLPYLGGSNISQNTYSEDYQEGLFKDLTDGGKEYEILHKTSTITVTKHDDEKLEGTFSLDLKHVDALLRVTGSFDIYYNVTY